MLNLKHKLNELNPQFLRELKGRLKTRNILLAGSISLLGQFILFMYFQVQLPPSLIKLPHANKYCTGQLKYSLNDCIFDNSNNIIINWQLWYQDVFNLLSLLGVFAILVGGTYLLINDLATEERRDTLNFIRLTPQSPQSILYGKMLGVPILLYAVMLLAIPLHLWSGLNAKLSLNQILIFYVILFVSSLFYYSGSLLFALIGSWLGSFQSWLGSGFVLVFLLFTEQALRHGTAVSNPIVILSLISPQYFIPHALANFELDNFHWFGLPLGESFALTSGFSLSVYLIGIYFIWQSLQRCYRDPNATMLSKQQSYLLTTSFAVITLGCANWNSSDIKDNFAGLIFLNLWLFLYLIAALTPNRQTLQDWARYRHIYSAKHPGKRKLIKDLVWGEKSPGVLAIAINALIAISSLGVFVFLASNQQWDNLNAVGSLIFAFSLVVIYAALAQLLLFMKNGQSLLWTNGILGAVIILPPIILGMLFSQPSNQTFLWLFSVTAPLLFVYPPNHNSLGAMLPFLAILGHASILGLLLFQTKRQLQKAGESATKALLAKN
ncbi:hypothetical protein [Nodularia sp. UHCC 0506]|uniref:hypothetical protein n=1 Tax=Nodularia sp. UHCC 0506 TaxID=3110243 RepID=UPI002B220ED1|nr:hypothetical protein [Nodularia sp. UHCC 0506]MEA5515269.1 hypothetical protein [Nodularia sp. UHCC 0506]